MSEAAVAAGAAFSVAALAAADGGYFPTAWGWAAPVALWLAAIIVNLVSTGEYYDIALRDFGLMVAALALARLAAGEPVTRIALDLGYESPSAFAAMFKRALGAPPSRYLAS